MLAKTTFVMVVEVVNHSILLKSTFLTGQWHCTIHDSN